MVDSYLLRLINTVGASNFLKYFDLFAENYQNRSNQEIIQLFSSEDWSDNSKKSISSTGKRIFKESLEKDVLELLSLSSNQMISENARSILSRYTSCIDKYNTLLSDIIAKVRVVDFTPLRNTKVKGKIDNITKLQKNILNSLKTISDNFCMEYQMNVNCGDKADIYCEIDNCCVIIEIDATRSDQVTKKFVSRIALNLDKRIIYIAICYPREVTTSLQELKKYFTYCKSIISKIDNKSSFTGILIDSKGIKEIL
ncbi:MAG: hypothetical protein SNH73_02570 [Rikenellaceae bacterium]